MKTINSLGRQFVDDLNVAISHKNLNDLSMQRSKKVHVTGAGRAITYVYEQLRNSAEYAEDHLLQFAIKRFYRRVFITRDTDIIKKCGEELIVELTLAGYLKNDTVTLKTIERINQLAVEYYNAQLAYSRENWAVNILAVEIEYILIHDFRRDVFIQFAYDYFLRTINRKKVFGSSIKNYEIALFIAIQRALLKSDDSTIRASILRRYGQSPRSSAYKHTNEMIDSVLQSKGAERVYWLVNRQSAPFRILWRVIDGKEDFPALLKHRSDFLAEYEKQIKAECAQIDKRINRGIIKSVIFLIVTKVIIGMAIEIPYDMAFYGYVLITPLIINLLFPPLYMILLRFTLRLPGKNNDQALQESVEHLFYEEKQSVNISRKISSDLGTAFNVVYVISSILIFGGVAWLLISLGFSLVHLAIFFVFLSAASFLGFRLSRQIREIEIVDGQQGGVSLVRDFFYIPFVVVGRWMSEKYARVNIVGLFLDMAIELPLKTILSLIRQWGSFINSKKDEL